MEGDRETVLVVSKLAFKEGSTSTFFERGAIVVAKIEDEQFLGEGSQARGGFRARRSAQGAIGLGDSGEKSTS
jgi:hypothetical protein